MCMESWIRKSSTSFTTYKLKQGMDEQSSFSEMEAIAQDLIILSMIAFLHIRDNHGAFTRNQA